MSLAGFCHSFDKKPSQIDIILNDFVSKVISSILLDNEIADNFLSILSVFFNQKKLIKYNQFKIAKLF